MQALLRATIDEPVNSSPKAEEEETKSVPHEELELNPDV